MKFLILAVCIYAAQAAPPPPAWAQASARTVFNAPGAIAASLVGGGPVAVAAVKTVPHSHSSDVDAPILKSVSDVSAEGFNYAFETGNGIAAESTGTLKKVDNLDVITVRGGYQYVAPDGTPVHFTYVADENGYQPQSNLLPVGPPVPVAIARALEYIATHAKHPDQELRRRV